LSFNCDHVCDLNSNIQFRWFSHHSIELLLFYKSAKFHAKDPRV
jgi:hypothetical protein